MIAAIQRFLGKRFLPQIFPKPKERCSFCGRPQDTVQHLLGGAEAHICNLCLDTCKAFINNEVAQEDPMLRGPISFLEEDAIRCSFCREFPASGKEAVRIEDKQVCRGCLDYCSDLIAKDLKDTDTVK